VELALGDVSDFDSVRSAMRGVKVLYHAAATMGGDRADHFQGTVVGTKNVFQAALETGVNKVVYVSSMGVLHSSRFPRNGRVDENFPLEKHPEARGDYSRAKLEAEILQEDILNRTWIFALSDPVLCTDRGILNSCQMRDSRLAIGWYWWLEWGEDVWG